MQLGRHTSNSKLLAQLGAAVCAVGHASNEAQHHPHRHYMLADNGNLTLCACRTRSQVALVVLSLSSTAAATHCWRNILLALAAQTQPTLS